MRQGCPLYPQERTWRLLHGLSTKSKRPPATITNLSPPLLNTRKLAPPIPNAGAAQPADGHEGMTIGLEQFRARRELWLDRMLIQPFLGEVGNYPINRRGDRR